MQLRTCVKAAIFVAAGCAALFAYSAVDLGFIGLSPAEAKPYYTKKRVNGVWITGRFPKRQATEKAERQDKKAAAPVRKARPAASVTTTASITAPREPRRGATSAPGAGAAGAVPLVADERLLKLQEALRARASTLTTGIVPEPQGHAAPIEPQPLAAAEAEPQSVSFDFRSGVKTTIFGDGAVIVEPFDVRSLKGLAAARPAAAADGRVGLKTAP
jgi:hypothetical protein